MQEDLPCSGQSFHTPVKFRLIQLFSGFLQIELLALQPGGRRKDAVLGQSPCHLGGGTGGLFHHQSFQPLKVRTACVAGKPGDCGIRKPQALGQLPDGGK